MENFSGIRFIRNEALTLLPHTIAKYNPPNVEIIRINPEDMQSQQAMALIDHGLKTFPFRVASVLKEESAILGHENADTIFELGQQILGISDQRVLGILRKEFNSNFKAGNVDEAVQLFQKYAQRLVSGTNSEDVLHGMRSAFRQVGTEVSGEASKHQEEMVAKALQALPEDLVRACNNIGVSIVVQGERYASSHYANRSIYIGQACFERGQKDLERALKEEMIHYVDSCIQFTNRAEWHEAANVALNEAPPSLNEELAKKIGDATEEQLIKMIQSSEIGVDDIDQALAILDRKIRHAGSTAIGKQNIDRYDSHARHAELLPDIVHAVDEGKLSEHAGSGSDKVIHEIYGSRALELVDKYWHEVRQVAENQHPALNHAEGLQRVNATKKSATCSNSI